MFESIKAFFARLGGKLDAAKAKLEDEKAGRQATAGGMETTAVPVVTPVSEAVPATPNVETVEAKEVVVDEVKADKVVVEEVKKPATKTPAKKAPARKAPAKSAPAKSAPSKAPARKAPAKSPNTSRNTTKK